ncbi:hypothetical protein [Lacrimispora sp.]|jgi:hypothetical protein|uniref:hypothetical protein n=1 Tax=Lacrimispora sp. TaxID=2719234 RepID=UPI00289E32C2|nr:hypothetical protein [Lacrimispora sp.]
MKALIAGVMIAIVSLLVAGCFQSGSKEREYQFAEDAKDGEYVRPTRVPGQSEDQKGPSYFTIQVNASPTVSRGGKRCNLMIGNPTENEQYVKVKLILDDTGEELFCSDILKPGERNAYVDLEQVPEVGEHTATAVFMVYDPESMEQITEIEASVLLTVE